MSVETLEHANGAQWRILVDVVAAGSTVRRRARLANVSIDASYRDACMDSRSRLPRQLPSRKDAMSALW
jgi:hypothetical protein